METTNRFMLSQTILKEWEACPYRLGKRLQGTEEEKRAFSYETDPMKRGVLFETLAIGAGLGGKQAVEGDVPKNSVYFSRIMQQAKLYKQWEADIASSIIGTQMQLHAKIEWDNGVYYIQGNIDRVIRDRHGIITNIDTKLTGDAENTYGPFQFGNEKRVDYTQLIHYSALSKAVFKEDVRAMYYVADCSKSMSSKVLEPKFGYATEYRHHMRCQEAYDGITESLTLNHWEPKPSKETCLFCPLGKAGLCKYRRTIPDIKLITLD